MMVEELMCGANTSFNMYPALTQGAADVILNFGTPEQQATYVPKMLDGTWAGTMCLTESHAGSDVGSASTQARRRDDGQIGSAHVWTPVSLLARMPCSVCIY